MKESMPIAVECFDFSYLKRLQVSLILRLEFGLVYVMDNLISNGKLI